MTDCSRINEETLAGEKIRAEVGHAISTATQIEWETLGVHLGYRYEGSPIIVPDGTSAPTDDPRYYSPTARPGHRAPHAWLDTSRSISTLDLFGGAFVLIRFGDDAPEAQPWLQASERCGMPLKVVDVRNPKISELYG